jgi:hypothetical protein
MAELEDYASAAEILEHALGRLRHERDDKREYLADLVEQLRIAELMLSEATVAVAAVEALLGGDLYEPGGPIIAKWDGLEATMAAAGMLPGTVAAPVDVEDAPALIEHIPEPEPEPEPETVEPFEPPPEPEPPPAPPAPPTPKATGSGRIADAAKAADDDRRALEALHQLAGGKPEVQVSLAVIAGASDIPHGSVLFVLRRLADAGLIEIVPTPRSKGAPEPNTYRLAPAAAPAPAPAPRAAYVMPEKVTKRSALRDRIAAALALSEGSTSGLASLLDVKEIHVCETLAAMAHEGIVAPGPMPEAGRRTQQWRLAN